MGFRLILCLVSLVKGVSKVRSLGNRVDSLEGGVALADCFVAVVPNIDKLCSSGIRVVIANVETAACSTCAETGLAKVSWLLGSLSRKLPNIFSHEERVNVIPRATRAYIRIFFISSRN